MGLHDFTLERAREKGGLLLPFFFFPPREGDEGERESKAQVGESMQDIKRGGGGEETGVFFCEHLIFQFSFLKKGKELQRGKEERNHSYATPCLFVTSFIRSSLLLIIACYEPKIEASATLDSFLILSHNNDTVLASVACGIGGVRSCYLQDRAYAHSDRVQRRKLFEYNTKKNAFLFFFSLLFPLSFFFFLFPPPSLQFVCLQYCVHNRAVFI